MEYNFLCDTCGYHEPRIIEGRGKFIKEERIIGTCLNCKKIFSTKDEACIYCGIKYRRLLIIQPVKLYTNKEYKDIKCPNCRSEDAKLGGSIFWD